MLGTLLTHINAIVATFRSSMHVILATTSPSHETETWSECALHAVVLKEDRDFSEMEVANANANANPLLPNLDQIKDLSQSWNSTLSAGLLTSCVTAYFYETNVKFFF
ncbi:hypothetical protein FQA47_007096 [Oryzias melastigma]|uniref:Uncharacterized protein n=1 Tax=Oryzias melastigma TaxID=30732 RepID=A0A834BQN3_ORYME|nr:hypothetical protein FQA47_007096 [Oryzias melastigma]